MALGPEHPGRVRGLGAGISPRQYFNLPKPQRMSFDDRLKDSLRREHLPSRLSQFIPNFDPSLLKPKISQSPKNPMSDKASCSGGDVRSLQFEDDTAKNGEHHEEKVPSSLKSLCSYVETIPKEETINFTIEKEVFGEDRNTFILPEDISQIAGMEEIGATVVAVYMRCLYEQLKKANMCSMVGFIDPALVSANAGTITSRSRIVASRLQKTDGEHIFMMPYNPGAKRETVYFLDPLPGIRVVDEEAKNIVNSAIKIYNSHIGRQGRKAPIWKTLPGTAKQPESVECGYYVMRFM
ncbi:unnamed protein product, partial [Prunus brigantina]